MGFFEWVHRLFVPSHHNAYRPHLLRRSALALLLGLALLAEGSLVLNLMMRQSGQDFLAAIIQSQILSLTNAERVQNRVAVLAENPLLDRSAQAKADDMARGSYFAHTGPDGKKPWAWIEAAGYDYQYAGENLAVRFVDSKDVVVAWMASPSHRANIVKGVYTEIGVGIAQGYYKGEPATFVVQHFGKPAARAAAASAPPVARAVPLAVPEGQAQVLGEASPDVAAPLAPAASFDDSLARQLGKLLSEPRASAAWMLGGIAALLMIALAFAFFHHLQIQPRDLLLQGSVVAGVALTLLVLNSSVLSSSVAGTKQSAGVAEAFGGVLISPEAAQAER